MKSYNPDNWIIALKKLAWKDVYIPKELRDKYTIELNEKGVIVITSKTPTENTQNELRQGK